jgi:polyisoprenoid-binding protein YceI
MRKLRHPFTSAVLALASVLLLPALASAQTSKVDPVHSFVIFRVQHMGAGFVYGFISGPTGDFTIDPNDPAKFSLTGTVNVDNLDTKNDARDKHLKSETFFNAKQFPTIDFKSTAAKKTGDNTYDVTGDLTLHGVTKSITIPVTVTGTGKGMQGETRTGLETTFKIKRSDYDMTQLIPAAGDEVTLRIGLEGIQQ